MRSRMQPANSLASVTIIVQESRGSRLDKKRIPCVFSYTSTGSNAGAAVGFDNEKAAGPPRAICSTSAIRGSE
jgi:hypothetical protein